MRRAPDELASAFARFAAARLEGADDVRAWGVERIHGGASRETYRLRLGYREGESAVERPLILRLDPEGSLIETDRRIEFAAYRAFRGTAVPVPEAVWLELDASWLGAPFFVMEELEGLESSPQALLAPPYAEGAAALGRAAWRALGEIARADPAALGLVGALEPVEPGRAWERELGRWERVIDEDALEPQPIVRAVIRRLRRRPPPPPARLSVVHGDFRSGNFLFDAAGRLHAVLDWEMAHLGDPLEDLAWSINPVWDWGRDGRCGALLAREEAIRVWEEASGLRAEPEALVWWELFACVKGLAIWVSSQREYLDGRNKDPILALSGWAMAVSQDRAALELLERAGVLGPGAGGGAGAEGEAGGGVG